MPVGQISMDANGKTGTEVHDNSNAAPATPIASLAYQGAGTIDATGNTGAEIHGNGNATPATRFTSSAYKSIEPTPLNLLRPNFIETTVLRDQSYQQNRPSQQAFNKPLSPEEAAREALISAYRERESVRVKLSMNYSPECALAFDASAKEYEAKRSELAALMPSGMLSTVDEGSFPFLTTKDTVEPRFVAVVPLYVAFWLIVETGRCCHRRGVRTLSPVTESTADQRGERCPPYASEESSSYDRQS